MLGLSGTGLELFGTMLGASGKRLGAFGRRLGFSGKGLDSFARMLGPFAATPRPDYRPAGYSLLSLTRNADHGQWIVSYSTMIR